MLLEMLREVLYASKEGISTVLSQLFKGDVCASREAPMFEMVPVEQCVFMLDTFPRSVVLCTTWANAIKWVLLENT